LEVVRCGSLILIKLWYSSCQNHTETSGDQVRATVYLAITSKRCGWLGRFSQHSCRCSQLRQVNDHQQCCHLSATCHERSMSSSEKLACRRSVELDVNCSQLCRIGPIEEGILCVGMSTDRPPDDADNPLSRYEY
jgi:hypothetical protein